MCVEFFVRTYVRRVGVICLETDEKQATSQYDKMEETNAVAARSKRSKLRKGKNNNNQLDK